MKQYPLFFKQYPSHFAIRNMEKKKTVFHLVQKIDRFTLRVGDRQNKLTGPFRVFSQQMNTAILQGP